MEKAYKIAHANFESEKLAHKISAKNAKNCSKLAQKNPKIAHKRQKHLIKRVKKAKFFTE